MLGNTEPERSDGERPARPNGQVAEASVPPAPNGVSKCRRFNEKSTGWVRPV